MSGIILNVTDLNSNSSHMCNNQNDVASVFGEIIIENIEEERNERRVNDAVNTVITSDINSNAIKAETPTDEMSQHGTPTTKSSGSNSRTVTIDHKNNGYDDSSAFDSSSDMDSDFDDIIQSPSTYLNNVNLSSGNGFVVIDKNLDDAMPSHSSMVCTSNDIKPKIGSIAVQNSTDITFGNKTFYQGPVTIKQFVYDKNKWREANLPTSSNASESDNLGSMKMENDEVEKKFRCTKKQALYGSAIGGVLACTILILVVVIKYTSSGSSSNRSSSEDDVITDSSGDLRVITRKEWLASPPTSELVKLDLPVSRVIIAHTASDSCTTLSDCKQSVKNIQTFHIENDFDDIGYNFLAGGDSSIYIGRSWTYVGAHTKGYNTGSICFAFIGTFTTLVPPIRQLEAVQKMIKEGIKLKKLTADYKLYGHRQFLETSSPGKALFEVIKTWEHYSNETYKPKN